jgi:hypothetical protein
MDLSKPPIPPTSPATRSGPAEDEDLIDELVDWAVEAEIETAHETTPEEAERGLIRRMLRIGAGGFLVVVGLFLLVLPGPGLVVIAAGLGLMARDVPFARRWLRIVRKRLPESEEGEVATWLIAGSAGLAVVSIGFSVWFYLVR